MIKLYKDEKRNIYMKMTRRKNISYTIESVTCKVYNSAGKVIETGIGVVQDKEVYYLLDTTKQYFQSGKDYDVEFHVVITNMSKLVIGRVDIKLL